MALSVLQVKLLKQLYTGEELWAKRLEVHIGLTRVHCSTIIALHRRGLIHRVGPVNKKGQRYDLTDEGMAVAKELM